MAVDFLRSCHGGAWRFYVNRPDVLVRGRYYFLPDGSPHLPIPHYFGSSTWRNGDDDPPLRLGEVIELPQPWDNGALSVRYPPPVPVGAWSEFSEDTIYPPAIPLFGFREGILALCWIEQRIGFVDADDVGAIRSPTLQLYYARILELIQAGEFDTVKKFLEAWIGPTATITFFPEEGLLPAQCFVIHPEYVLVFSPGTVTTFQLAVQAFQSRSGPTEFGDYGTLPLWNATATTTIERMEALGAPPGVPITLSGHSYGAAVTEIVAARIRLAHPERDIRLLTFATPKPGERRLVELLQRVHHVAIVNEGDIVPLVPPSNLALLPFVGAIGLVTLDRWSLWHPLDSYPTLNRDGDRQLLPLPSLDANILSPMIADILLNVPIRVVEAHYLREYVRRLRLRTPLDTWPMNALIGRILFPDHPPRGEGVVIGGPGSSGAPGRGRGVVIGGPGSSGAPGRGQGGVVVGG